jgi:ElaA protein
MRNFSMPSEAYPHPEERPLGASRRTHDLNAAHSRDVNYEWHGWSQLSPDQLYELLEFRQAIFVVEQASPYPDLDGRDSEARHLTLRRDGALIGYLRLIAPDPLVRIGRVAAAQGERGKGYARLMMDEALRLAGALYPASDIEIGAQTYLEPFYRSFGFIPSTSPYDDFGVPHIDMVRPAGT